MSAVIGLHLELRGAVEALQCAGELLRTPKHLSLALKKNKGLSAWVGTVQITAHCPPSLFLGRLQCRRQVRVPRDKEAALQDVLAVTFLASQTVQARAHLPFQFWNICSERRERQS